MVMVVAAAVVVVVIVVVTMILIIMIMSQEFMELYKSTCRIFCKVGPHYLYVQ